MAKPNQPPEIIPITVLLIKQIHNTETRPRTLLDSGATSCWINSTIIPENTQGQRCHKSELRVDYVER